MSRKKPEVERISNILTGLTMHLRIIHKRDGVDLSEPVETLENIIRHIDDGEVLQ